MPSEYRNIGRLCQLLYQGRHRPRQPLTVYDGRDLHLLCRQQRSAFVHQPRLEVGAANVYANVFHLFSASPVVLFFFSMASTLLSNCVTKSRAAL